MEGNFKIFCLKNLIGDIISDDGKHDKNVQQRKNKGLGIISQVMQILESVFFGKYYFEVALVLRSSLLLSSMLLNSEAWVNLTDNNIRALEQTDEILLSKILDCEANTSNVVKYLELGVCPIRFEIMKRKLLFLHYLQQQDKSSMIFQVFQATLENPTKNDFVENCKQYMNTLCLNLPFDKFGELSKWRVKKLIKEKTSKAAFNYLMKIKEKQSKIVNLKYDRLEIQEYLVDGNRNTKLSKIIFKARSLTLDIKLHKKWKFKDTICVGCGEREESGEEILKCDGFDKEREEEVPKEMKYSNFFDGTSSQMVELAQIIKKRLKVREKIMEETV